MLIFSKKSGVKLSAICLFISLFSSHLQSKNITNIGEVESLCKEQSEEMLSDQGLEPKMWTAQNNNSNTTFNVEGRWKTRAGIYIVECELQYNADDALLELSVIKE